MRRATPSAWASASAGATSSTTPEGQRALGADAGGRRAARRARSTSSGNIWPPPARARRAASRGSICVPPKPGITCRLISGWPSSARARGDALGAGHLQLVAAAQRVAVDGGDHRRRAAGRSGTKSRCARAASASTSSAPREGAQLADVGAGHEQRCRRRSAPPRRRSGSASSASSARSRSSSVAALERVGGRRRRSSPAPRARARPAARDRCARARPCRRRSASPTPRTPGAPCARRRARRWRPRGP